MKDENAFLSKDKASLKLIIGNKLKEFFQSHDIDKMTQKYSDDLRTLSILYNKTKQLFQHNKMILEISQHQCRKCQLRMLEEMNQNRAKTPTKQFPYIKQDHSHNHSLINLRVPHRSMTPELNITGSHIGVVPLQKLKGKVNKSRISPSKNQNPNSIFIPSRSKSPIDLSLIKNSKNITKSPTAFTAKASKGAKIKMQGNSNKGTLTPSKTDRNITPKHKDARIVTSLSKDKDQAKSKSKDKSDLTKHSRFNTSVSGEKVKQSNATKKSQGNTSTISKENKAALSPTVKRHIKTPLIGKNKGKEPTKTSGIKNKDKDGDVQYSINEINKTVKGLKESLKIMDDNDEEIVSKGAIGPNNIKKPKKEINASESTSVYVDAEAEDSNDESILIERQLLKREKEKRIMDKLRNEKNKVLNREPSPDFNLKNKGLTVCSNGLEIESINRKDKDSSDLSMQKNELYKSVNYEISIHQKNEIFGISNLQSVYSKTDLKQDKGEEHSYKTKGKDQDMDIDKGNYSNNNKSIDKIRDGINNNDKKKNNYQIENTLLIIKDKDNDKDKDNENDNDNDRDRDNDNENESKLMQEKREKIREKVMEKRKEKEKSKESIVKDKNIILPTPTSTSNNDSNPHNNKPNNNTSPIQNEHNTDKAKRQITTTTNKDQSPQQLKKPITVAADNKSLKLLVLTLNSGFIDISKKISIITSSPQLLPAFQLKHLLVEKISILMKQSSKIKAFLSKYDLQVFTKPFSFSKIASSSISLITKEDELGLCKRPQPREILNLFTALYIILNESHYEVPTKDLVVNMVQVLLKKYQVDSIKSLLLNIIPKKASVTEKQMDLLMEIKEASPIILIASEITKLNKAASYICFALQEIFDYIFVQYNDGTTLYQIKKAVSEEKALEKRITLLQSYL